MDRFTREPVNREPVNREPVSKSDEQKSDQKSAERIRWKNPMKKSDGQSRW